MAVGIIIGGAFGTIVKSLVEDILMPPIGILLGGMDFSNLFLLIKTGSTAAPYASVSAAKSAGAVTLNYGIFLNSVTSFLIVAFALFMLIKGMNRLRRTQEAPPAAATTKLCPFCQTSIPIKAIRCPNCTSQVQL
ncbi:MAG: large conductance mechanosensitive channel protein MscL, partial [Thermodesulfobacteriota bacterium]